MAGFQWIATRFWLAFALLVPLTATAQSTTDPLRIATVTRAPFSLPSDDGGHTGFSIDLMNLTTAELGLEVEYERFDTFGAMMAAVEAGEVDGAIANISITAAREQVMDFTQPIFDGGIQVMLQPSGNSGSRLISVLITRDIGLTVLAAVILLLAGGMLMWVFERRRQPYFDLEPKEAVFPALWWALNVVVNGGFEERMPRSPMGRVFGVALVISSLFIVSIFVAQITAALTLSAIQESVDNLNDLDGRQVGTLEGSTTADFLDARGISHATYADPDLMLDAFGAQRLDAVVFDGPILAYYAETVGPENARLLDRIYRPEKYGVAFPTGSELREPMNRAILGLREDGSYAALLSEWFGNAYTPR